MLDFAVKYKTELETLYQNRVLGKEKYKFWVNGNYWSSGLDDSKESTEWVYMNRVSVTKKGDVLAYFSAYIRRPDNIVRSLSILSFDNSNGVLLLRDLEKFIDNLFVKYDMFKIKFSVLSGNPAQKLYEKFITKVGGRQVGVSKKDMLLIDNKRYDKILYEVLRENYIKRMDKK